MTYAEIVLQHAIEGASMGCLDLPLHEATSSLVLTALSRADLSRLRINHYPDEEGIVPVYRVSHDNAHSSLMVKTRWGIPYQGGVHVDAQGYRMANGSSVFIPQGVETVQGDTPFVICYTTSMQAVSDAVAAYRKEIGYEG